MNCVICLQNQQHRRESTDIHQILQLMKFCYPSHYLLKKNHLWSILMMERIQYLYHIVSECCMDKENRAQLPYFFDQTSRLFVSPFVLVRLLFEDGLYFAGKPAGRNDDWNGDVRAIQIGMIDAGSSTRSLSVLLSAVETSLRTRTALEIAQFALAASISMCICVPCTLAVAIIRRYPFYFAWNSWLCGYYSKAATIRGRCLIKEIQ